MQDIWYGRSLYESVTIKEYAEAYLKKLPLRVRCLVTIGASGSSLAAAMLCLTDRNLKHVHFRKPGEYCHASVYIGCTSSGQCAIVDDLIDSGKTVVKLHKKATDAGLRITCVLFDHYVGSQTRNFNKLAKELKLIHIGKKY